MILKNTQKIEFLSKLIIKSGKVEISFNTSLYELVNWLVNING